MNKTEEETTEIDYYEWDLSDIKQTILKNILDNLSKDQKDGLYKKIEKGLETGLNMCKNMTIEKMDVLINKKPSQNLWKLGLGPNEIKKYGKIIKQLRKETQVNNRVNIKKILESKLNKEEKRKILNLYDILQKYEPYTLDYYALENQINNMINKSINNPDIKRLEKIEKKENELKKIIGKNDNLKIRILDADIDNKRKAIIYEKYLLLEKNLEDSTLSTSIQEWIEEALKTPYTRIKKSNYDEKNIGLSLIKLKKEFEENLSELNMVLEPLLTIFNNKFCNKNSESLVIGLLGSPGIGKTSIGQIIAKAWDIPFKQISLGGILDSSILDGQHSGWVGSSPGRFTKALQEMGYINGIIFLDEIDKLGETQQGLQVQYSLLHSLDPIQNHNYIDHYLGPGLPLDLSKCLIICAMNKLTLDSSLINRMHIINIPDYTKQQKINILYKHLFPYSLKNCNLNTNDIILPLSSCEYILNIVEKYNGIEGGVRNIKTCIRIIVDKLNLLLNTTNLQENQLNLSFYINNIERPIIINKEIINSLYNISNQNNFVINSMYN
jgi:ATP-dependent Lon protease